MQQTQFSLVSGRLILLGTLSILIASCGLVPRIPIQMSRVVQVERYDQVFIVAPDARQLSATIVAADGSCNDNTTAYFSNLFSRLIGSDNWNTLRFSFGDLDYCDELLAGSIALKGNIQFIVYLLESDLDQFEIEGSGHYFLIRKSNDEIMMAGQFEVTPTLQSVNDLRRGYLDIDIQLITTKVFDAQTYLHESDLKYRIFMDTSRAGKDTYSIDYTRKHQAYLGDDLFGEIVIADTGRNTKLLDLRGKGLLQSDY